MSLFKKHSQENEENARVALIRVAQQTISKYVLAQKELSRVLVAGDTQHRKKEPCMMCKADVILGVMAKLEAKTGQIVKAYELMFNEVLDTKKITDEVVDKFYPELYGAGNLESTPVRKRPQVRSFSIKDMPADVPEEIKNLMNMIKDKVKNMPNTDVDVQVVEVKGKKGATMFGVDPNDYKSPEAFHRAVQRAQRMSVADMILDRDMPVEEQITENIIHNTEAFVDEENTKAKRRPKSAAKAEVNKRTNT